jgi:hypothetical protein
MPEVSKNPQREWFKANDISARVPLDAELHVDTEANTITVEVVATDEQGRMLLHGSAGVMTRMETFPLKVPPPAGLLEAYQHTVRHLRRERDAATAIRYETAQTLIDHLGLDPVKVFEALDLSPPTHWSAHLGHARRSPSCVLPSTAALQEVDGFTEADAPDGAELADRVRRHPERQDRAAPPGRSP